MSEKKLAGHEIALVAILFEANKLGYNIQAICDAAVNNMHSAPYRGGAQYVVPAQDAIKEALRDVRQY